MRLESLEDLNITGGLSIKSSHDQRLHLILWGVCKCIMYNVHIESFFVRNKGKTEHFHCRSLLVCLAWIKLSFTPVQIPPWLRCVVSSKRSLGCCCNRVHTKSALLRYWVFTFSLTLIGFGQWCPPHASFSLLAPKPQLFVWIDANLSDVFPLGWPGCQWLSAGLPLWRELYM